MDTVYTPSKRPTFNAKQSPPAELSSSLKDIQIEYARALDQIEALKYERDNLRSGLKRALNEQADQEYRDQSIAVERASVTLQQSYAQKALIQSEQRMMDLEEENIKLKHLLDTNLERMGRLQREMSSYQDKCEKIGHIEVYNQHLKAEMQYLDQEFQAITKRVEELDEEKTKAQINKTVSVKYSQGYNQTLVKYAAYIVKAVESMDASDAVRTRFEELFPKNSNMMKLVGNSDYTNLTLKSLKFIADFIAGLTQELGSPVLSPFSTGDSSPRKRRTPSSCSVNTKNTGGEVTPFSGNQSPKVSSGQLSSKRGKDDSNSKSRMESLGISPIPAIKLLDRVKTPQAERTPQPERTPNSAKKSSHIHNESRSSNTASFGKNDKSRSVRSSITTPSHVKVQDASGSVKTLKNLSDSLKKVEMSPMDKSSASLLLLSRNKTNSMSYSKEEVSERTAAELELIEREKSLIEKERELMARKRELLERSNRTDRELLERSNRTDREKERAARPEAFSEMSSAYVHKQSRNNGLEDTTFRNRECDSDGARSGSYLRPILKSQGSQGSQVLLEGERSMAERSMAERSMRTQEPNSSNVNSSAGKLKTAKDVSKVLREKTQHLAQVLNKAGSYEDEIQMAHSRSDREISNNSNAANWKSREMTPMSSFKSLEYDNLGALRYNSLKTPQSLPHSLPLTETIHHQHYDESALRSVDEGNSESRRPFYGRNDGNVVGSNSNIASYQHSPRSTGRTPNHKRDELMHKKVSFDHRGVDEMREDQEEMMSQHYSNNNRDYDDDADYEDQDQDEDEEERRCHSENNNSRMNETGRSGRSKDEGRGTQFSTFSVSFGRTESSLKRYSSPPREPGSILDATKKRRVDHVAQSYDVVTGDDVKKVAMREQGKLQYKVSSDTLLLSESKRSLNESRKSLTPVNNDRTARSDAN